MIILAYLLQNSISWRNAIVRIKMVVHDEEAVELAKENLRNIVQDIRIEAQAVVISSNKRSIHEIINQSSAKADLVLLGLAEPGDDFARYYERMQKLSEHLPDTLFVLSAQDLSFEKVLT
jgi:predicted Zn-dependent protease with MMP-like domain